MSLFGDLGDVRTIDGAVRLRLSSSLEHIADRAKDRLETDAARFASALDKIRSRRQHPGVFARYYELISALTAQQLADANSLLDEIVDFAHRPAPHFEIVPYERERLGSDYDRYPRLIFAEYAQSNPMTTPTKAQSAASAKMIHEAIEIISRVDLTIHAEIEALLVRIYLANGSREITAKRFGGVTSFLAWGASFINTESYKTCWDSVQFLVHEITHGLLFGLSFDEPLVLNPPDESYKSPLRSDLRPMDGIFHAALVCGRLADFNRAWLDSGLAEGDDKELCREAVERNTQFFRDGVDVIIKHGELSKQGSQLVERSRRALLATI